MNEDISKGQKDDDYNDISKKNLKAHIKFFFSYFLLFIYLYFFAIILKSFTSNKLSYLIISFILYIPVFIYIYIAVRKQNISWNEMGFTKDSIRIVVILAFIYIGLFIYKREYTLEDIIDWIFFLTCTGITEELIFRGYLYEKSKKIMSRKRAIFWNCLLFTFIHISPQSVLQELTAMEIISYFRYNLIGMSLMTIIFIKIKEKTNTIWIPIILHSILNFI